eukprot:11819017-Heterocapsa_arctica.AAC.1
MYVCIPVAFGSRHFGSRPGSKKGGVEPRALRPFCFCNSSRAWGHCRSRRPALAAPAYSHGSLTAPLTALQPRST